MLHSGLKFSFASYRCNLIFSFPLHNKIFSLKKRKKDLHFKKNEQTFSHIRFQYATLKKKKSITISVHENITTSPKHSSKWEVTQLAFKNPCTANLSTEACNPKPVAQSCGFKPISIGLSPWVHHFKPITSGFQTASMLQKPIRCSKPVSASFSTRASRFKLTTFGFSMQAWHKSLWLQACKDKLVTTTSRFKPVASSLLLQACNI